jgi:hypothetical protein
MIQIDAPDVRNAFRLERRLRHLHAMAVGRGPQWVVELQDAEHRDEEIAAGVRQWLREIGSTETTMRVDGAARVIRSAE